jgi:hypothetical protein
MQKPSLLIAAPQAVIMAQEVGKVVSASEALRYIIQRDRSTRV